MLSATQCFSVEQPRSERLHILLKCHVAFTHLEQQADSNSITNTLLVSFQIITFLHIALWLGGHEAHNLSQNTWNLFTVPSADYWIMDLSFPWGLEFKEEGLTVTMPWKTNVVLEVKYKCLKWRSVIQSRCNFPPPIYSMAHMLAWLSETEQLIWTDCTLLCLISVLLFDACSCNIQKSLQLLYKDEFYG